VRLIWSLGTLVHPLLVTTAMTGFAVAIACFAYIFGLLLSGCFGMLAGKYGVWIFGSIWLGVGAIAFWSIPRLWRSPLNPRIWLVASLIGFCGSVYFQVRSPQPGAMDISRMLLVQDLPGTVDVQQFKVTGKILTAPKLTQNQKLKFELDANQVSGLSGTGQVLVEPRQVKGRMYVTLDGARMVAIAPSRDLFPGRNVTVTGSLYQPQSAKNPGGFDFQHYLLRQGIFAGLNGTQIELGRSQRPSLLWTMQQRIIETQVKGLGNDAGQLVSAMVMGTGSVDVPQNIGEQFRKVGLAHALAASGFQVSLLLEKVMQLTQRSRPGMQFGLGLGTLIGYIGLTGIQASVFRAGWMGVAVLMGRTLDRKVKPFGALLFSAVMLLLWNPLWIWDLGFQFSFAATIGLLVTVPALMKRLDWLPTAIASLVAVPLAAYIWTLPIQLHVFGIVSPYSILINVLSSLLISCVSLGGMLTSLVGVISPEVGSLLTKVLYLPTISLIKLAGVGSQLPGANYAVGAIALWQVLALYGLYGLIGWTSQQQYRWKWSSKTSKLWEPFGCAFCVALVAVPVWHSTQSLMQVTTLETSGNPVFVVQDRGKVGLINSGTDKDVQFVVLPFLRHQGVNQVDWAIAPALTLTDVVAWQKVLDEVPVRRFYNSAAANRVALNQRENRSSSRSTSSHQAQLTLAEKAAFAKRYMALLNQVQRQKGQAFRLSNQQQIKVGSTVVQVVDVDSAMLQMRVGQLKWLLLNRLRGSQQREIVAQAKQVDVVAGSKLSDAVLTQLQGKVVILGNSPREMFRDRSSQVKPIQSQGSAAIIYRSTETGAVTWRQNQGFVTAIEPSL
jgi:competence protein ComEC